MGPHTDLDHDLIVRSEAYDPAWNNCVERIRNEGNFVSGSEPP